MRIASWNVNSVRARAGHVERWIEAQAPDLLALQETKCTDDKFPATAFDAAGYHSDCLGQSAYNGVAMLSRTPFEREVQTVGLAHDDACRVLGGRLGQWRIINLYVPNGSELGSDKYGYKLAWLDRLIECGERWLAEPGPLVIVGDFNIAPADRDVHDPALWEGRVLVSEPERQRLRDLLALGLTDLFREFEQPQACWSWWDYRANAFRRNRGLRIDLVLGNEAARERCTACTIDREPRGWQKPSDHAPVVADFAD